MRVKYNRVSTLQQSGDRFTVDQTNYDLVLFDKIESLENRVSELEKLKSQPIPTGSIGF